MLQPLHQHLTNKIKEESMGRLIPPPSFFTVSRYPIRILRLAHNASIPLESSCSTDMQIFADRVEFGMHQSGMDTRGVKRQ